MGKLRNTRCLLSVPRVLSWGKGQQSPTQGWSHIILWAQILCVHIHIHLCHVLTSSASEEAKRDLQILILTVMLQRRKENRWCGSLVSQLARGNSTIRTLPSCLWVLGSCPLTPHFSIS